MRKHRRLTSAGAVALGHVLILTAICHAQDGEGRQRGGSVQDSIDEGRALLAQRDLLGARDAFAAAVQAGPFNEEAHFFLGATRIAALALSGGAQDLMDGFGISDAGRDPFDWMADFTRDPNLQIVLPDDSPSGGEVQGFLEDEVCAELEAAAENLAVVSQGFIVVLTASETGMLTDTEIDFGDVALARSALAALRVALVLSKAIDLDFDIDDFFGRHTTNPVNLIQNLLDENPHLLRLATNASRPYEPIEPLIRELVDTFFAGVQSILNETDDQADDLIVIYPEDMADLVKLSDLIRLLDTSLEGEVSIGDGDTQTFLNLKALIESRLQPRGLLPEFDAQNKAIPGTLPDPDFGGVFHQEKPGVILPAVRFASSASEAGENSAAVTIDVTLTPAAGEEVTAQFAVTGGTATADEDYVLLPGSVVFPAGVTLQTIAVAIVDNTTFEPPETIVLELQAPLNADLGEPGFHVLTIEDDDTFDEESNFRVDRWKLKTNRGNPAKGTMQWVGELDDAEEQFFNGGDVRFEFDAGAVREILAEDNFTLVRGSKHLYRDATRKGKFLIEIGGSSRSKFSIKSTGDFSPLSGVSPMRIAMNDDGFSGEVSIVPSLKGGGNSDFKIARELYESHEVYVDALLVKRSLKKTGRDSMRLTLRIPALPQVRPERDTLRIDLGFFVLEVQPGQWKVRGPKLSYKTTLGGKEKIMVKVDRVRGTISVSGKKLTLAAGAVDANATISVSYGGFMPINTLRLQRRMTNNAELFRY